MNEMVATFVRYLTPSEERQLLSTVAQYKDVLARRDSAWMRVLRQTGIRIGALAGLTVHDAKEGLRTGFLYLRPAIQKRGQGHSIHLTKKARAALKELLKARREMGHAEIGEAPLIMSRNHRPMSVRSFQARMRKWCDEAGLNVAATPHWFRHTLAKRLVAQSTAVDPLGIVQSALGHLSRNSTGVYAQPDREAVAEALEEAS